VTMNGNATVGTEYGLKTINDLAGYAFALLGNVLDLNILGAITGVMKSAVPVNKGNVLIRVQGQRNAKRIDLLSLANAVALDRFPTAYLVSAYGTQGLDSDETPWAEVRLEFVPNPGALVKGILNPANFAGQMNVSDTLSGRQPGAGNIFAVPVPIVPPITSNDPKGVNLPLPSGGGTRGHYLGRMAVQTFAGAGAVPNAPPAADTNYKDLPPK
jgi:hypothetical protein